MKDQQENHISGKARLLSYSDFPTDKEGKELGTRSLCPAW